MPNALAPSFYGPVPDTSAEGALGAYLNYLHARNGVGESGVFVHREEWLEKADGNTVRHQGRLDGNAFERGYERFQANMAESLPLTALLAFVKVNAGEAYGVEVLSRTRHRLPPGPALFEQVERVVAKEETYHTRILLGATRQFDLPSPSSAWRAPWSLRALIGTLAYSPKGFFHPILLGAEIGGVFTFNWMLKRVREIFRNEPQLRDGLEARLIEILVDEIGHISFNRLAVGPWGLSAARKLASLSANGTSGSMPEFRALGWTSSTATELAAFDFHQLPEEVKRRAFFV